MACFTQQLEVGLAIVQLLGSSTGYILSLQCADQESLMLVIDPNALLNFIRILPMTYLTTCIAF